MDKINVAVVGLGWWGPKLVKNFLRHPQVGTVFGWDLSERAVQAALDAGLRFEPLRRQDDLFDASVSAWVIATPPKTHFALARNALERGRHVLLTKPPVETKEELDALASLVRAKNLTFMIDATYVFNPGLEAAATLARDKGFESLKMVRVVRYGDVLRFHHKNRLVRTMFANRVDIIKDLVFHDVSVLCSFLPYPLDVDAIREFRNLDEECSDSAILQLRAGNIPILVEYSWIYPERKSEYEFYYGDRYLVFDDFSPADKLWEFTYDDQKKTVFPFASAEPLYRVVDHFLSCLVSGHEPRTGLDFARNVMESIQKIDRFKEKRT